MGPFLPPARISRATKKKTKRIDELNAFLPNGCSLNTGALWCSGPCLVVDSIYQLDGSELSVSYNSDPSIELLCEIYLFGFGEIPSGSEPFEFS